MFSTSGSNRRLLWRKVVWVNGQVGGETTDPRMVMRKKHQIRSSALERISNKLTRALYPASGIEMVEVQSHASSARKRRHSERTACAQSVVTPSPDGSRVCETPTGQAGPATLELNSVDTGASAPSPTQSRQRTLPGESFQSEPSFANAIRTTRSICCVLYCCWCAG